MKPRRVFWYARGKEIKWMGPYASEIEGWQALTGVDGLPIPQAAVWCTDKRLA